MKRRRYVNPFLWAGPYPARLLSLLAVLLIAVSLPNCGRYRSVPAAWDPVAYRLVTVQELKAPRTAGLAAGQKVEVHAYFWEFLIYDPAMVRNYLTLLRHPLAWPQLEWFAVYGTPQMQGYFDRVAMDEEQRRSYALHRLDPVMIFGELASMGGGLLYLRVHRLHKLEED
jgi:hypothetical protein